jgi:hypothetical protein
VSIATARAEITAALNTIDGVKCYPARPSTPRTGDAWLRWQADRGDDSAGGFDHVWRIVIVTPQGEAAADAWVDDHIDDVLTALRPVTWVTAYEPANLGVDNSPVYGILITSERE